MRKVGMGERQELRGWQVKEDKVMLSTSYNDR